MNVKEILSGHKKDDVKSVKLKIKFKDGKKKEMKEKNEKNEKKEEK